MGLGKFKQVPRWLTFPIWVTVYLGMLGFAACLALVAPFMWLIGSMTAGDAALTAIATLPLAAIAFGVAKLINRLAP